MRMFSAYLALRMDLSLVRLSPYVVFKMVVEFLPVAGRNVQCTDYVV